MKVQRVILLSILLMMAFICYGCKKQDTALRPTTDFFKDLKSYEANVCVTFLKDKQPNIIKMKQDVESDGHYTMTIIEPKHLEGTALSYDGEKITESYPKDSKAIEIKASPLQNELLLTTFAERYKLGDGLQKQSTTLNGEKMVTYEVTISGGYKYLAKEKVWLREKDLAPVQMLIYDEQDQISIEVLFEDFKYNS